MIPLFEHLSAIQAASNDIIGDSQDNQNDESNLNEEDTTAQGGDEEDEDSDDSDDDNLKVCTVHLWESSIYFVLFRSLSTKARLQMPRLLVSNGQLSQRGIFWARRRENSTSKTLIEQAKLTAPQHMKLNLNRWKKNHGGSQVNCPSTVEMDLFNENSLFKAPISPTILTMVSRRKLGLHIVLDKRGYVSMRVALDCQIIPVQTFPIIIPCLVLENHRTAVPFQFLATKPSKDSALLV